MSDQTLSASVGPRKRPRKGSAWPRAVQRRVAFYSVLAFLNLIAMSEDLFTLAVWMFVLPAIPLLAIQWLTIYLPLIDWPIAAWRQTRSRGAVMIWLGAACILPLGVPAVFNLWQAGQGALALLGDRMPAKTSPAGRILVTGKCGGECLALIRSGAATSIYRDESDGDDWKSGSLKYAHRVYASDYCEKDRPHYVAPLREHPGLCIVDRRTETVEFDSVVRFEGFGNLAKRTDPRRIEVWRCDEGCRLVARQTERQVYRMSAPLIVDYPSLREFSVDPQWRRKLIQVGDASSTRVLPAVLDVSFGDRPKLGENGAVARLEEEALRTVEALRKQAEEGARLQRLDALRREQAEAEARLDYEREAARRNRQSSDRDCRIEKGGLGGTFSSVCSER